MYNKLVRKTYWIVHNALVWLRKLLRTVRGPPDDDQRRTDVVFAGIDIMPSFDLAIWINWF